MKFATNVALKKSAQRKLSIKEDENANNILNVSTVQPEDVDTPILSPPCLSSLLSANASPEIICRTGSENLNRSLSVSCDSINCRLSNGCSDDEGAIDSTDDYFEGSHSYLKNSRSRVNSVTDDSGFTSSENDDKDDIVIQSLARLNDRLLSSEKDEAVDENGNWTSHRITKSLSCTDISTSPSHFRRLSSPCTNSLDSLLFHRHCRNSFSTGAKSIKPVVKSKNNEKCVSTDISAISSIQRRSTRRTRPNDHNNNRNRADARAKKIHTMLPSSPGRLNDCFQEQGLFSVGACIVYTLVLMMFLGAVGLFMDTMRSAIGKEDLKKMRQDLVRARRRRSTAVTSG